MPEKKETKDDLAKQVKQNTLLLQEIAEQNQKLEKYFKRVVVLGYLRIILILAPIIIALIFIPPLLGELLSDYQRVLEATGLFNN